MGAGEGVEVRDRHSAVAAVMKEGRKVMRRNTAITLVVSKMPF